MRKIVVGLFMSLDGVVEGPGTDDSFERAGWTMSYFSDEVGAYIGGSMADSDALLLGRVTYEGFAAAFASQSDYPTADAMNNFKKFVVSNTLTQADWQNSTLISGDAVEAIKALKAQDGKNINISGSAMLVQSLLEHGLIDELDLLVYPVVIGMGKRLFSDGLPQMTFELAEARTLPKGVVLLRYTKA